MMTGEKTTCPSCGSALPAGQAHCDICGEDVQAAAATPAEKKPETVPPPAAKAPSVEKKSPPRKPAGKKAPAKAGTAADAMFTTTQWVVICVSSFILGGVLTATLLPPADGNAPQRQESAQNQPQQPQIDFARLEEMRTFLENNPGDQDTRLRYANDLHDARLLDQAIAQYKVYLEAVPDNPDARVDLGICYFELKQYPAAIAEMKRAVNDHPDHQLGNYNLGIVHLNAGDRESARSWFIKARDLDPTSPYGINAAELLKTQFSEDN